ncbi:MAG: methyltransferase domain-containing protein, partial [Ilumatobacteraceae bacterium]
MASGFQLAGRQAEAYHAHTGVFMDGSARLLADGAGIRPGDVVLDLACGTGLVAGHTAPLVGSSGRVVGVDVNAAMLEVARGINGDVVEFVESSCELLPFEDATFTHVLCQQGLQFFPDPVGALREAGRVLRPGAALIATVWATPDGNPYIEAQLALFTAIDP